MYNILVMITVEDVDRNNGLDFGYADITGYDPRNGEEEVLFNPLNTFKIRRVSKVKLEKDMEYGLG